MRFTEIAKLLAQRAEACAQYLLPNGRRQGHEWRAGSVDGSNGRSLSVQLVGGDVGAWRDWGGSEGDKGDLFGLWRAVHGLDDKETAQEAQAWLGLPQVNGHAQERALRAAQKHPATIKHPTLGEPAAVWPYYDAHGGLIGYECRWDREDDKTFMPYTHAADGWQWKGFGKPLPLYKLPVLLAERDKQVIVCEGAKAADAAGRLFPHAVTTTWPGGCKQARHADWSALAGRNVVLWPDADEPGAQAMADVAAALPGARILDVSDKNDGWDAADYDRAIDGVPSVWARARVRNVEVAVPVEAASTLQTADAPEPSEQFSILTEHYLAGKFCEKNPGMRYVAAWNKWMEWDSTRWVMEETRRAYDLARAVCVQASDGAGNLTLSEMKKLESAGMRAAVENMAREDRRAAARVDQWDKDLWLLNTPAGIVNLRDGSLRPAMMDDYVTKVTSVGAGSDCQQWMEFLRTVCDFDDDLVAFLQRMIGYALTGDTREQCLFFCYGTGANGKGTFLNTLSAILGEYAIIAGMDVFTESKHDRHPQELARLRGARMVCAQETEQGRRWAESRIKALTGGDPITAHFMRQNDFTFMPQFKLIIAGNHKPGLRNVDEAMKRRLHLVPFTVTIPPEKRDKELGAKLAKEASGILGWAIDGCLEWQRIGLAPPKAVRIATEEYLESQDSFAAWMDECCNAEKGAKTRTSELYKSFKNWTEARGDYVFAQGRFNEMLEHKGHGITKTGNVPFAAGLSLKQQTQVSDMYQD